jgi:PKD repeat protein
MKLVARAALLVLAACLAWAPAASAAPPNASFTVSPAAPHTLETVTFTSTSTGDITSQSWDLDNQGGCNDATGPTAETSFPTAGVYRIGLCVTGPEGEAAQAQLVTVSNQEPLVSFIHLPARAKVGAPVSFVSTASDPDGSIVSQEWDLDGDGAFDDGTDVNVSRAFSQPRRYAVSLRVTDNDGAQVTLTEEVSVRAPLLDPFPTVGMEGIVDDQSVRVDMLRVNVPPGAVVRIRCRGPGCPDPRAPAASRLRRFRQYERTLGVGAVLEVFVTKPGTIGKYTLFKIRSGKPPARRDLCVYPRGKRVRKCPGAVAP